MCRPINWLAMLPSLEDLVRRVLAQRCFLSREAGGQVSRWLHPHTCIKRPDRWATAARAQHNNTPGITVPRSV